MALAAGNPPLLIAALQHDQDACKLRIQIARHNASRWRPLGASQLAFSSGAFAGRVEEGAFAVEEELK